MNETRHMRFKRMANRRVNKVLEQLRILGNLSNKSYYDYTDKEISIIFKAVEDQLRTVKARFRPKKRKFRL